MAQSLFLIWLRWAVWITLVSVVIAAHFAIGIALYMYITKGAVALTSEVISALESIGYFWFAILWSITLPLSTFFGMKQLFKYCYDGRKLQLFSCTKEPIDDVYYEDIVKVWRKWLFLIIWGVAAQLVVIVTLQYVLGEGTDLMQWFNIYYLYVLVMTSSLGTLFILVNRCKLVELEQC